MRADKCNRRPWRSLCAARPPPAACVLNASTLVTPRASPRGRTQKNEIWSVKAVRPPSRCRTGPAPARSAWSELWWACRIAITQENSRIAHSKARVNSGRGLSQTMGSLPKLPGYNVSLPVGLCLLRPGRGPSKDQIRPRPHAPPDHM